MALNKVRGLRNITTYALYSVLCLVLNRETAENIGRSDKAVSPTYFNASYRDKAARNKIIHHVLKKAV
jgi:hypothetical protein